METRDRHRIFLNLLFLISGFCFATWASRIPTLKQFFGFNDAELGTVLLFMPVSSLIGLPISGWLVARFDSRVPVTVGFSMLAVALSCVGFSTTRLALIASLCFFAFSMRIFNIAVNTQALHLQKHFDRKINGSFHGLWSTGGILGVGFSTLLVAFGVGIGQHFLMVSAVALITALVSYRFLLRDDRATEGNKLKIAKPDPYIMYLGLLVFFASICEGGMFDWSGIFFREVVREELFTLGYFSFMIFMAISRFASDAVVERIGMAKTYILSSALVVTGVCTVVIFPFFWSSLFGFCLVGLGTASVIPVTYSLAAGSRKYSPGLAVSIIATYGIAGAFLGPPLIGYLSHAFNLKLAFLAFALAGVMLIPVSRRFFRHAGEQSA